MTMKLSKPSIIEPGLLSLFRMFMWIQWLILILGVLQLQESDDVGSHATILLILLSTSFLLLYLRSERLERWLRRFYLPVSIIIAGFNAHHCADDGGSSSFRCRDYRQ